MPQELWHPGKDAKLDRVIQLNCGEVRTHASYKATRTWENFNNRGTKMILLSDELWSIANNSKSFANGSKLIIRNNLGFYKHSKKNQGLQHLGRKEEEVGTLLLGTDKNNVIVDYLFIKLFI